MTGKLLIILLVISKLMFTTLVWGDTVSTLLEEGIYAEETKGDLDEAISIYQKIISDNEGMRTNIAKVYYRLGACYLKKGDDAKAEEVFKQIITIFPKQEQILSDVKTQLAELNALEGMSPGNQVDSKSLEIGPEPWKSGETCWYNIKNITGRDTAKGISTIKDLMINGNDLWRIEQYVAGPASNDQIFTRVDTLKEDFTPVAGRRKDNMGYSTALYKGDHIELGLIGSETDHRNEVILDGVVYDNDQVLYLLRRLPLTETYSTSFSIFVMQSGALLPIHISVQGKETLTVPAGTFDCYFLELEINSSEKRKLWISADDQKYLVRYDFGQVIVELDKVAQISKETPEVFKDSDLGISIFAPTDWHFFKSPVTGGYTLLVQMLPSELKAWASFIVVPHGGILTSARSVAEGDASILKNAFKNYIVRPESWTPGEIGGFSASTFIADYHDKDKKMVEYRTYILGPANIYWFIFRIEKEAFEENKTDFDAIVKSLKAELK